MLYIAGIVQLRHHTTGRAYYRRKLATGKPRWKRSPASASAPGAREWDANQTILRAIEIRDGSSVNPRITSQHRAPDYAHPSPPQDANQTEA